MENKPLIIGLTGAFGSGKSTAAEFFASFGFSKISLASFLEEEARKKGFAKITRQILQDLGNELRVKFGRGILAKRASSLLKKENLKKAVIDGIRNIGEIEEFKKRSRFVLLSIASDRFVRFERLRNLKRREALTWDLFEKLDYRDLGIGEKQSGLQTAICIVLADSFIENNGTLKEFKHKLESFLEKYG